MEKQAWYHTEQPHWYLLRFESSYNLKAKPNVPFCLPWADGITRGAWSGGTARGGCTEEGFHNGCWELQCNLDTSYNSYRATYLAILIFHSFSQAVTTTYNAATLKSWNLHLTVFPSTGETTAEPSALHSRPACTVRISVMALASQPCWPNHSRDPLQPQDILSLGKSGHFVDALKQLKLLC